MMATATRRPPTEPLWLWSPDELVDWFDDHRDPAPPGWAMVVATGRPYSAWRVEDFAYRSLYSGAVEVPEAYSADYDCHARYEASGSPVAADLRTGEVWFNDSGAPDEHFVPGEFDGWLLEVNLTRWVRVGAVPAGYEQCVTMRYPAPGPTVLL